MAETKIKTGNIYSNTNPYVLREATVDDLGGVKAHSTTELDTQAVNIDPEGFLKTKAYKAGIGINITEDGTINATGGGSSGGVSQEYVDQQVATKQDVLVSGQNIKTINGQELLGEGNIEFSANADALNEDIIKKDALTNDIALKVKTAQGEIVYENITPDVATADKKGLITANQKQILDIFKVYGRPEITTEIETSKFKDYNPAESQEIKTPEYAIIGNDTDYRKTGVEYFKEGDLHYWSANGKRLDRTHSLDHYLDPKAGCVTFPSKIIPQGYNAFFMGCKRTLYASVPALKIEKVWFVNDEGILLHTYVLNRLTNSGTGTPQTFELLVDGEKVEGTPALIENKLYTLDGLIVDVPTDATRVIVGISGSDIVGKTHQNWFFWAKTYKKADNFIADNLRVAKDNVIGLPDDELNYNNCELIEIPTNYLTDFVYPGGDVTAIGNQTSVFTKDIPFDYASIEPYKLFVALPESISTSSLPNIKFLDENKEVITTTSGADYTKEPNILIKGYYGLLRDIPTNTKFLRYQYNYLTRSWLKVFYVKNRPERKMKEHPIYSFTNQINLVFGDSIIGNFDEYNFAGASVPHFLSETLKTPFLNVGFGGCRMTDRPDAWNAYSMTTLTDSICSGDWTIQEETFEAGTKPANARLHLDNLQKTDFNQVNTVIIAYGINDFHADALLGTVDKNPYTKSLESFDKNTYAGATQYVVQKLQKKFPNLRIILSGMKRNFKARTVKEVVHYDELPESGNTELIYFVKEQFKSYVWDGLKYEEYNKDNKLDLYKDETVIANKHGKFIPEFNNVLKEIADVYGIEYIDNMNLGITQYNAPLYYKFSDGTHPSQHGRFKLAESIGSYLKSHSL